ncbi:MAG: methylmalonyl-CoA mutase [Actinobacteria bacterium]|nr:methylmalonyl-CoA mutase [Actinomycetota bacterium]
MTDDTTITTTSDLPIAAYHDSTTLDELGVDEDRGFPPPGTYPFTRGFREEGYRTGFWDWEMYAGFGSAENANERYRFLLENGATGGVSVALDLPTQIGLDSDHPLAQDEVGLAGVALDSFSDIERLFSGVDLGQAGHVFSTANAIGPIMYAWVLHYCHTHDVDPATFRLQIQNDPIKEYIARGTQFLPVQAAVRLATDVMAYSHEHTPTWLPVSVSGSHMKQAGASPAEEAAFTLANATAYMEQLEAKGVKLADFNPTLEIHFCTDMDFFEEVAKYRAVRRAWSEIGRERFGVPDERLPFRLHAATSGLPLTAQQPLNNIARITLQALAQVLGGCEATRTASYDEALAIPREEAAVVSLRINQIIAHETGIAKTTDPLGGSYYVEALTKRIHQVIQDELERIGELGGALAAVEAGYFQERLARRAYEDQRALDTGERIVVGVNAYVQEETVSHPRFAVDPAWEAEQLSHLRAHREGRNEAELRSALAGVRDACASTDNVVPSVLAAVAAGATIGEICHAWREVFGEFEQQWAQV